jgi:predicted RNA binding protein YcfA (HicA-like mRNA interferase family)
MGKYEKVLWQVLRASGDQNITFEDLTFLLENMGFEKRIKGSHHLFSKEGVVEIINLQPAGNKAKSYQIKQVRNIIIQYKLVGV